MSTRTRLFKKLGDFSGAFLFSKAAQGNPKRAHVRHMGSGSGGTTLTRRTCPPLAPALSMITPNRSFIFNFAAAVSRRRMEYSERRTLGYTPEQMYNIVANVEQYQNFVPWCKKSRTTKTRNGQIQAELEIGFPPVTERYISEITYIPNHQVRAVCIDGSLFSHLETVWKFSPGPTHAPDSCKVEFFVSFEFKSLLHSQLAGVFFDEVAKQMVSAFETRAASIYRNRSRPETSLRRRSTA